MPIDYAILCKSEQRSPEAYVEVERIAGRFLEFLKQPETQESIKVVHTFGASSVAVQKAILPGAIDLGFTPEKKGLFHGCAVSGWVSRPF